MLYYKIMKEIMDEIESRFEKALEEKTGWGKTEVLLLYKEIASKVYLEKLDQFMARGN